MTLWTIDAKQCLDERPSISAKSRQTRLVNCLLDVSLALTLANLSGHFC